MAYESYLVCDVCGIRVENKKENKETWIDVRVSNQDYYCNDADSLLEVDACSMACATSAIRKWLEGE